MSEPDQKPTPETDALAMEMNVQGLREWTLMNHARRLARERDEAREELRDVLIAADAEAFERDLLT